MTGPVAAALVLLALCDGAFSGFRSGAGRTGLIRQRAWDVRAQLRGLAVVSVLLLPALGCVVSDLWHGGAARWSMWAGAGTWMLAIYLPYGVMVLLALAAYATLPWRLRFWATAVILGPFTLARPWVAVAGGALAAVVDPRAAVAVGLSLAGVLLVGPVCDRLWYSPP
ncbi:hypothetical protein GCM10023321_54200 [Pseudonocardia eucalypti]|uniref:Uncharacterized protein n=1 Tax=Pseudonocardia eucalypti TaxID=648755 RepID=A0ABP9QNL9_9PSEU|nr:hypothetical protein [Pseudonocardia eucalypti]